MTLDCQALVHLLHNLEYTGWPYHGSYSQFQQELNDYIKNQRRPFTLGDDKKILKSNDLHETAKIIDRPYGLVAQRREMLEERKTRKPYTGYEDEIILTTKNLRSAAKLMKRDYTAVWQHRRRLLRRRAHVRPTVHKPAE
jgi:hypothetical protein